jgi:hypothetical protein
MHNVKCRIRPTQWQSAHQTLELISIEGKARYYRSIVKHYHYILDGKALDKVDNFTYLGRIVDKQVEWKLICVVKNRQG